MKFIFYICALISLFVQSFAHAQTIQINHQAFELKTVMKETEEGFERQEIELYRDHHQLLSHTLRLETGDCSIVSIELGDYEVKNNQIIFYSYWASADRQGLWMYPYGVRKQVYVVDAKGTVKLLSSVIYVEDIIGDPLKSNPQEEYLQFLHTEVKTEQQRQSLHDYIQMIQKKYKARFVHGQERALLLKEVKTKLAKQITTETKDWKEMYGSSAKM